jgi:GT2 family glycosyltransferase
MSTLDVSVVVNACRDSETLRVCLRQLVEQARRMSAEVILAVNTAEDELPHAERDALDAIVDRIVFEPEVGKSCALNTGGREARGRVLAMTDDDATICPNWLEAISRPLLEGDRYAGTGGPVMPLFPEGGGPDWFRNLMARGTAHLLGPYQYLGPDRMEYTDDSLGSPMPFGANWAFRREVFVANPMNPELGANRITKFHGCEDTELNKRLLRAGHRLLYVPEARVYHPVIPERMTLEYVRYRYHAQGRAAARMNRILGDPPADVDRLRRKIRGKRVGPLRRLLLGRRRAIRREMRGALYAGELEETLAS